LTIVAPSGCGKSTLLRIIAGLDSPREGAVEIQGKVMNSVPARLRNVAMVFQSDALYSHMTCFENLAREGQDIAEVILATEDPSFATDPQSTNIETRLLRIDFARPGAAIFRSLNPPEERNV
jgi:ABC-type Fe3+/spermidine/putrescine transport system ATPase subunit